MPKKVWNIISFEKGINKVINPRVLTPQESFQIKNLDITNGSLLKTFRTSFNRIWSQGGWESLFSITSINDNIIQPPGDFHWFEDIITLGTVNPDMDATNTELTDACNTPLSSYANGHNLFYCSHDYQFPVPKEVHLRELEYPIDDQHIYYAVGGVTYNESTQAGYDDTLPFQDINADPYWNSILPDEPQNGNVYRDLGSEFLLYAIQSGLAAQYGYDEGAQIHIYDMTNNILMADSIRLDHINNSDHYKLGPPKVCYSYIDGSIRIVDGNYNRNEPNIVNDAQVFIIHSNHMAKVQYLKKILFNALTPEEAADIDNANEFTGGLNILNDDDFSLGIPLSEGVGGASWFQRIPEETGDIYMPIVANTNLDQGMYYHPLWYSKDDTEYPSNGFNPHYKAMSGIGSIPSGDPYPGSNSIEGQNAELALGITPPDDIHDADAVCFIQWVCYSHSVLDDSLAEDNFLFLHGQHGDDMHNDSIDLVEYNNYINGLWDTNFGFDETYQPFILHQPFTPNQQNEFSSAQNGLHQLEFEYKLVAKCTKNLGNSWLNHLEGYYQEESTVGGMWGGFMRLNFFWGSNYDADDFVGFESSIDLPIRNETLNTWSTYREYTFGGPIAGNNIADYLSFMPEFIGDMVDDDNISNPGDPTQSYWMNGDRIHFFICVKNVRLSPWDPSAANMIIPNPQTEVAITPHPSQNIEVPYLGDDTDPWHLTLREPDGTTVLRNKVDMLSSGVYAYDPTATPIPKRRYWNGWHQHTNSIMGTGKYLWRFRDFRYDFGGAMDMHGEDRGHRGPKYRGLDDSNIETGTPQIGPLYQQVPFATGGHLGTFPETIAQNDNGWFSLVQGKIIPGTEMDTAAIGFPDPDAYNGTTPLPNEIPILSMYQRINKSAAVYSSYKLEMQAKYEYGFYIPLGNFWNVDDGAAMYDETAGLNYWYEVWIEAVGKRLLLYKYVDPDDGFEKVAEWGYVKDNVPSVSGADVYALVGFHVNLFYREPIDLEMPETSNKQWRSHTVPFLPVEGTWSTPGSGQNFYVDPEDPDLGIITDFKQLSLEQQLQAIYTDCVRVPTLQWNSYQNDPNHSLSGWQFIGQWNGASGDSYQSENHHITLQAQMGSDFNVWRHYYIFDGISNETLESNMFNPDIFPREDVNDDNEVLLKKMNDLYTYDYIQINQINGCCFATGINGIIGSMHSEDPLSLGYGNVKMFDFQNPDTEDWFGITLFDMTNPENGEGISDITIQRTANSTVAQDSQMVLYEGQLPINQWMQNPGLFPEPPINRGYDTPGGYFVHDEINYSGNDIQSLDHNLTDSFMPEGKVYIHVFAGSDSANGLWAGGYYQVGISYYDWDSNETEVYFDKVYAGDSEFYIEDGKMLRMNIFFPPIQDGTYENGIFDQRVAGFRIYMRKRDSCSWDYLMLDCNFEKGYMVEVPGGDWKGFRQLTDVDQGIIGTSSTTAKNLHFDQPPIVGFYELNQWDGTESNRFRYKTSAIIGRRMFIGNVAELSHKIDRSDTISQYQIKNTYPDRMMKSPTNQFDIFPKSQFVDVAINDGDEIIHLTSLGRQLLQFRKDTLYIIDVSKHIETLAHTHPGKGVDIPSQVCTFPDGVAWVNSTGVYVYNGQDVIPIHLGKISRPIMKELFEHDSTLCMFYLADKDLLVVMNSYENKEFHYSLKLKSWSMGQHNFKKITAGLEDDSEYYGDHETLIHNSNKVDVLSNIVTTRDGRVAFVDINGLALGGQTMLSKGDEDATIDYFDESSATRYIEYQTGDLDFQLPSVKKTIHKVVIKYKSNGSANTSLGAEGKYTNIYWAKDGEHALTQKRAFTGVNADIALPSTYVADEGFVWKTLELDPGSDAKNIYSFCLGITDSSTTQTNEHNGSVVIMIDSIQIFYKSKGVK